MGKVTIITGRNYPEAQRQYVEASLCKEWPPPVYALNHPWTDIHPRDGAESFRAAVAAHRKPIVIASCLAWMVAVLGEMVAEGTIKQEEAVVVLCEDGKVTEHRFDKDGVLEEGWPIGYFAV